jgi:hypothetical protein
MAGGVEGRSIADLMREHVDELTTVTALTFLAGTIFMDKGLMEDSDKMAETATMLAGLLAAGMRCGFMDAIERQ